MDTYQNIKHKVNKMSKNLYFDQEQNSSLFDFERDEEIIPLSEKELVKALTNDLKNLLEIDEMEQLVHEIFKLETQISFLNDKGKNVPDLNIFYQNLSPVLLRSLLEVKAEGIEDPSELLNLWKEAIRIAIEEEFHVWQEKIF